MSKYITTSIAYINAPPHIGFLFELISADVLARYHRLQGDDVYFVTGTDEHGTKVAQAAEVAGLEPKIYADQTAAKFEALGKDFNIDWDYFIRTTNPQHEAFVQEKWQQLQQAGVLEKRSYTGLYCSGCEAFKTEGEIADGKCVIHEKALEKVEEENYFLIVDEAKKQAIKAWIEIAVFPATRRQEVINSLDSGHFDAISVSRPKDKLSWGIAVPNDNEQVMYVWVDALFNYISALKINGQENLWPAEVQVIGKDILKFHAIIWPALLLACGYELPKKLLVHGFINVDGKKMSKSLGNVITPAQLLERYGVDGTRYLLLRQLNFYDDSNFVWDEFDAIYNGELANGIGNLLARIIGIGKKVNLKVDEVPKPSAEEDFDFGKALETANNVAKLADELITKEKLWESPETKTRQLETAAQYLLEAAAHLEPFMPSTAAEIRRQLTKLDSKPLFPRIEK